MALSRKTQPDRPIWPAVPTTSFAETADSTGRARVVQRSSLFTVSPPQRLQSVVSHSDGFGSFSN